ncbi:MAG: peptidase M14 [Clostridia bacterium]|nr:peptidase M14 [Clostridia bacterium]
MEGNYKRETDRERPLLDLNVRPDPETVSEISEIMAERYSFLSLTSIGESVMGKRIHMLSLGNGNAGKSVLYVGAHHGAEWITTLVLLRLVNEMCEYIKASKQPFGINLQMLLATRCIHIVPQLNPDGCDIQINGVRDEHILYERLQRMSGGDYSRWQANARGVDLNHNYNGGFLEYKRLEGENGIFPGPTRYSGEYPLSEPETAALAGFIRYENRLQGIITLHSAGEEIYYSSGGIVPDRSRSIGEKMAQLTGYRLSAPEGLSAYGGLTDWYIREFSRPSFTIECGTGENPIPETAYFPIYARLREMLMTFPMLL